MTIAFFDTNIYIHYQSPKHVDWHKEIGADEISIVIHPHVFKELNRVKDNKLADRQSRKRANYVIQEIDDWFESDLRTVLRPSVGAELYASWPASIIFSENSLVRDEGDDCHLAAIFEYLAHNEGQEVVFVTNDTGLRLRCRSLGIRVFQPPIELRLPEEVDEVLQENKKLKQTIEEQNKVISHPIIRFKGAARHTTIHPIKDSAEEIEEYENRVANLACLSKPLVDDREHCINLWKLSKRVLELDLEVSNSGGSPALNTWIQLDFSEVSGVQDVVSEHEFKTYWFHPEIDGQFDRIQRMWGDMAAPDGIPPSSGECDAFLQELEMPSTFKDFLYELMRSNPEKYAKDIPVIYDEKLNCEISHHPIVAFKADVLSHNRIRKAQKVYIVFDCEHKLSSFSIPVKISSDSLPQIIEDSLNVVFGAPRDYYRNVIFGE